MAEVEGEVVTDDRGFVMDPKFPIDVLHSNLQVRREDPSVFGANSSPALGI